jgi:hypothetical protein
MYTAQVKTSLKVKKEDGSKKKYVVKKPCDFFESTAEAIEKDGEVSILADINEQRKEKFIKSLRVAIEAKVNPGKNGATADVEDLSDLLDEDEDDAQSA